MNDPYELIVNRAELKEDIIEEYGYPVCQFCGRSGSYIWEVHHIVYRSERPKHPMLHNKINLILLCADDKSNCHKKLHAKKDRRNKLLVERGLDEIFDLKVEYF